MKPRDMRDPQSDSTHDSGERARRRYEPPRVKSGPALERILLSSCSPSGTIPVCQPNPC